MLAAKDKVRGRSRGDRLAVLDRCDRDKRVCVAIDSMSLEYCQFVKAAEGERWRSGTRLWRLSVSLSPGVQYRL